MLGRTSSHRCFRVVGVSARLAWTLLVPGDARAQGEEFEQRYSAFGVAMGAGVSGVLQIAVTRWSTDEERALLINSLIENGQEKTVELLRDQKETGWANTQMGRGMGGTPSSRLHYAYEHQQEGKRVVVLVTDRTMRIGEVMRGTRSSEYDVSAIVMELTQEGDEEKGQGVFYPAIKFGFDKEKNTLEIEYLGTQPIRLTSIDRDK